MMPKLFQARACHRSPTKKAKPLKKVAMKCSILANSSCRDAQAFGYDIPEAATSDCTLGDDPDTALPLVEP